MVKSMISILVALLLLTGAAIFESVYVNGRFQAFSEELTTLSHKVEEERATEEDGKAIKLSWEHKKDKLHVWIPHNDIARVDDILAETIKLIGEGEFALANAKIDVLLNLCKTVPGTYEAAIENIL